MVFEAVQNKFAFSVFDLRYSLVVISFFGFVCGTMGYYMYKSFTLHGDMSPSEDHIDSRLLHQIFLILQFVGVAFAILLSITFASFLGFLIFEGCLNRSSEEEEESSGLTMHHLKRK